MVNSYHIHKKAVDYHRLEVPYKRINNVKTQRYSTYFVWSSQFNSNSKGEVA